MIKGKPNPNMPQPHSSGSEQFDKDMEKVLTVKAKPVKKRATKKPPKGG